VELVYIDVCKRGDEYIFNCMRDQALMCL